MPSQKYTDYRDYDKLEKEGKAGKDALKPYMKKLLKRCLSRGIKTPGITFTTKKLLKVNDPELYEWVASQLTPEQLDQVRKKEIDLDKLNDLSIDKVIDMKQCPEVCFYYDYQDSITVRHNKG